MDTSPIVMFDNYDQDFQQIITSIGKKLGEKSEAEDVGEPLTHDKWVFPETVVGGC